MKLLSFRANGVASWGAVIGEGIVDLAVLSGYSTLREALENNGLERLPALLEGASADHLLESVELLPVIPNPPKILCIGTNYHDHRIETGREVPERPVVFARFANSQVAHGVPLLRPSVSEQLDFEGEIAVIIGQRGRHVLETEAWQYIAGYAPPSVTGSATPINGFRARTSSQVAGSDLGW